MGLQEPPSEIFVPQVGSAEGWLNKAEKLLSLPPHELLNDRDSRDLASFYLYLTIQACIDLSALWVADAGWPIPEDAAAVFDVLADYQAIDRDVAGRLRGLVAVRDQIEHDYYLVDHVQLQNEFRQGAETLRRFLTRISAEAGL